MRTEMTPEIAGSSTDGFQVQSTANSMVSNIARVETKKITTYGGMSMEQEY